MSSEVFLKFEHTCIRLSKCCDRQNVLSSNIEVCQTRTVISYCMLRNALGVFPYNMPFRIDFLLWLLRQLLLRIIEIFLKECMFKLKHISKSKSLPRNTWQLALPRKNIVYCALNSSLQDLTLIFYRVYDAIDYVDWFELSCPWFHSAPSLHNFYIIIVNWPG